MGYLWYQPRYFNNEDLAACADVFPVPALFPEGCRLRSRAQAVKRTLAQEPNRDFYGERREAAAQSAQPDSPLVTFKELLAGSAAHRDTNSEMPKKRWQLVSLRIIKCSR